MTKRFENKVILITGGASGIGLAAAQGFAKEGGRVVLADLNADKAASAAEGIRSAGGEATSIATDVTDFSACEAMVAHAKESFGGLHIAFNNAGMPTNNVGGFEDVSVADWEKVISTNLSGVFYCMKAEVPLIEASGGGAIVNTASIASVIAAKGMAGYVTSKHGVAGLSKAASLDLIDRGIRVNAVCPGFVDTAMTASVLADPAVREGIESMAPIGRVASAVEIANTVLFLASEEASFMVGALLSVDGGLTIQ